MCLLVPRFADPGSGQVLIDGYDLREVTLESLGRQVGVVFQDIFLFHASLADSVCYARESASGQGTGLSPSSVTVTSRRAASSEPRVPAAVRACRQ